jgi:PLP dependent protein
VTSANPQQAQERQARRDELAANLTDVRAKIADACASVGRDPAEVTLIAVTKTFPAADVALLAGLGLADIGENRDAEAAAKAAECTALGLSLRWHFVGQLQVNKAASVVSYAYMIHSVDRLRLIAALGRRARTVGRPVRCLVQVNLDESGGQGIGPASKVVGQAGRGGIRPADAAALADAIAAEPGLLLSGVMAVAPLGADPRQAFSRLREVSVQITASHPQATVISAGMSADLADAITEGATHVRIGTALLGGRRAFVR